MFLSVNSVSLYYKQQGAGAPIILLHGNGESHAIFDGLTEKLSLTHSVYALDSRSHGRSGDAPLDYTEMARDVISFIRELKLEKPILYGFSDGGIIGLLIAMEYPEMLSKLIISGANLHPGGVKGRYLIAMRAVYLFARNPKYKLMLTQPHIDPADLGRISVPTLVLAGSRDMIREAHTRKIAACIPDSTLRILPGETHESYVLDNEKLHEILAAWN